MPGPRMACYSCGPRHAVAGVGGLPAVRRLAVGASAQRMSPSTWLRSGLQRCSPRISRKHETRVAQVGCDPRKPLARTRVLLDQLQARRSSAGSLAESLVENWWGYAICHARPEFDALWPVVFEPLFQRKRVTLVVRRRIPLACWALTRATEVPRFLRCAAADMTSKSLRPSMPALLLWKAGLPLPAMPIRNR